MVLTTYIDPAFLTPEYCRRIRHAMDAGQPESADVLRESIERHDRVRRADYVEVTDVVLRDVESRLDARRETIGSLFGVALTMREGAGFVRYGHGGFYRPHRDRATVASWSNAARRTIAVVVFLNSSRDAGGGDFSGGLLRVLEGPVADFVPKQGTLVAFPADVLHEVTVVRDGTRDAIVDWFYETT